MTESYPGLVTETGFRADDAFAWKSRVKVLRGQRVTVTIEKEHATRTPRQNRRYWVQCSAVAELLSTGRHIPLNKDQAHVILASAFLGLEETKLGTVPISTRNLSVEQFNLYMDKIDAHFAAEGTPLPTMEAC